MPSKKNKDSKAEPLKPLGHYVKDRLELTKQLFSCLKKKQIRSRLPANLQNLSIERIQQLCLDEILCISSKRLLAIINNTTVPIDTESDSDIEHISLSEISSNSDLEEIQPTTSKNNDKRKKTSEEPVKEKSREKSVDPKSLLNKQPGPKEMTMLELLELQARARAIRSQLALEPVTKIELDSDDDDEENGQQSASEKSNTNDKTTTVSTSISDKIDNSKNNQKSVENSKKNDQSTLEKSQREKSKEVSFSKTKETQKTVHALPQHRKVVIIRTPEKADEPKNQDNVHCKESQKTFAPPIKLKRNFSHPTETKTTKESMQLEKGKTESVKEKEDVIKKEKSTEINDEKRSASRSPDVITMEQNIATYFISDSEDETEEPPSKKPVSPQKKIVVTSVEIISPPITNEKTEQENTLKENEIECIAQEQDEKSANENESTQEDDDENVVNIMSDTEIDININSDKEDDEEDKNNDKQESSQSQETLKSENLIVEEEFPKVSNDTQSEDFDDDVVEICHSEDELLDSDKPSENAKNSDESETWEQRYLKSSTVKTVLKTTKLASKVRDKIVQNKRILKKRKDDKEKEIKEKISKMEEGSMKQFEVLKESKSSE
ncbi:hypothetical protein PVAND_010793 [Polypedilum vanderplanki]|uniref:Uncharacterized protein n=1 Tax=Polypedilum vanderplanki TaxID=319348 RepID=A0A9J6CHC6_POLVA|nr:hypothetical protein PVAND_010793 [Polypedilum vanderplanki]